MSLLILVVSLIACAVLASNLPAPRALQPIRVRSDEPRRRR